MQGISSEHARGKGRASSERDTIQRALSPGIGKIAERITVSFDERI